MTALTLTKETGAGLADANSYADLDDGNVYHAGHLYATAWTAATDEQKAVALVMATRLIDAEFQFNGKCTSAVQALQWPRASDQRSWTLPFGRNHPCTCMLMVLALAVALKNPDAVRLSFGIKSKLVG